MIHSPSWIQTLSSAVLSSRLNSYNEIWRLWHWKKKHKKYIYFIYLVHFGTCFTYLHYDSSFFETNWAARHTVRQSRLGIPIVEQYFLSSLNFFHCYDQNVHIILNNLFGWTSIWMSTAVVDHSAYLVYWRRINNCKLWVVLDLKTKKYASHRMHSKGSTLTF
jgi:hypothetical protein